MPFQDPVEMGMTLDEVISTVQAQLITSTFEDAFGTSET